MTRRHSWLRTLLLGVVTWPLVGLVAASAGEHGLFLQPGSDAHRQLYAALQWLLFAPIVVQLVLHFPLFGMRKVNVAIHAAAAAALCLVRITADPYPRWVFAASVPEPAVMAISVSRDLLVYVSVAMAVHLVLLVRRRVAEERTAAALKREFARSQREMVTNALAPDLIVRSFDEIARRVRHDPERAEALIECFGDFLRTAIPDERPSAPPKKDRALLALRRELGLA